MHEVRNMYVASMGKRNGAYQARRLMKRSFPSSMSLSSIAMETRSKSSNKTRPFMVAIYDPHSKRGHIIEVNSGGEVQRLNFDNSSPSNMQHKRVIHTNGQLMKLRASVEKKKRSPQTRAATRKVNIADLVLSAKISPSKSPGNSPSSHYYHKRRNYTSAVRANVSPSPKRHTHYVTRQMAATPSKSYLHRATGGGNVVIRTPSPSKTRSPTKGRRVAKVLKYN